MKQFEVSFLRTERNYYRGTVEAESLEEAKLKIQKDGIEAFADYNEDSIDDVLSDENFEIQGHWVETGNGGATLDRLEKPIHCY